jgi:6-phosphogluconolactonase
MSGSNAGTVLVAADGASLAQIAAHLVRALIGEAAANPERTAKIAISGGSTPRVMNRHLASLDVPWDRVDVFWVDERFVPYDNPRSNYGAAREDLFSKVTAPRVHAMPTSGDLNAAARDYAARLRETFSGHPPVFDLILLGIGDDGHTASLFPGEPFVDEEHQTVIGVPASGDREARLSLSRPVIAAAKRIVVLAQGEAKRGPIADARSEGSRKQTPARITRECQGEVLWLIDKAACPT